MSETSELVVVRTFSHPLDAYVACSALQAAGLLVRVADDHIVAVDWLYSNAVGGVKLVVRAHDLETAHSVLGTVASLLDDAESGGTGSSDEDVCPNCGSRASEVMTLGKRLAVWSWLIVGVPLFPVRRRTRCKDCGHAVRWFSPGEP
jgi:hypothetical protein